MKNFSEKAIEQLHAKIPNDTNRPHAQDLKFIWAKRLAYYGKRKVTRSDVDNKPELAVSRGKILHWRQKRMEINFFVSNSAQPSNDSEKWSRISHSGKDLITISGTEVSRKCIGWTQSKAHKSNHLSRKSPLYQARIFSQDDESEKAPFSKMEKTEAKVCLLF